MVVRSEICSDELVAIKDITIRIKIEPPDVQWRILRKFIHSIRLDKKTNNYKMNLVVRRLSEMDSETAKIILERVCYFANPHDTYNSTVYKVSQHPTEQ